jgi:serine protease Do/serine protease DegQ
MIKRLGVLALLLALGLFGHLPPATAAAGDANLLPSLSPMLERVSPAVVNIAVRGTVRAEENPMLQDPFFRHFFDLPEQPPEREIQSIGSGVIIDAGKGYVITNHHVIANAKQIAVILNDRRRLDAEVVGTDSESDIAVLQVKAADLSDLPFGDSDNLKVGDFVVAIGNPFGLGQTATIGIVSALGRSGLGIEGFESFIQTDASINPGNSGGALVDQQGKLIGVNTAILSRGGGNIGIGFAIPVNMVRNIVSQIITHGEVRRGRLGVLIQDLTPDLADALGVEATGGAVISEVVKESPAERAGLEAGDIVVALNGKPIRSSAELRNRVGLMRPGQRAKVEVIRDGKHRGFEAKLAQAETTREAASPEGAGSKLAGATLAKIPPDHPLYGKVKGVLVTTVKPASRAAEAGLRPGDIIVAADQRPVSSPAGLSAILRKKGKNKPLLLQIRRDRGSLFIAIR